LDEVPTINTDTTTSSGEAAGKPAGIATTISRNAAISLARVAVNSLVALVLPAYLTHYLPATTYGAWVLILQLGAYVSYLDFGVQTGIAKFVAEYDAMGDREGASRHATAGLAIMSLTGALGFILTLLLAWQVPRLFNDMPASLYQDVRISVVLIGASLSFGLVCSVFSAIFLGLQRYFFPMAISIANRASFTIVILVAVAFHGSLVAMATAVAFVNIITGILQVFAWHKMASHICVSRSLIDYRVCRQMTRYCFMLSIWSMGMLCVSGLDLTIVGHYDFNQTAYYSIATLPTSFILMVLSSVSGPMMPASSALSTQRSAVEMGAVLAKATRYSTILLLLTGLPVLVFSFPILHLWVGPSYALSSLTYLRILVLANIIRSVCLPYAIMLAATGRQGAAAITAISEALVNLGSSVYLASRFGAIGVAFGTLLGSAVSVSLHFAVSMHFTRQTLAIARRTLLRVGLFRPAVIVLPSILLLPFWWPSSYRTPSPAIAILWVLSTITLAWFGTLDREERSKLTRLARARFAPPVRSN
jgi:O-antigen/teichoic acid export membrane protein